MRYGVFTVLVILFLLVLASGCTQRVEPVQNETNESEQNNTSWNNDIPIPKGDFAFKIHGEDEFELPPNKSIKFYVVFNNVDDDEEKHKFIARVHPLAVDFDVMAAYQCSHFTTCNKLISDMNNFIKQPKTPIWINYTFVGLYTIDIRIPSNAVNGTYMYNMVACEDMGFDDCTETKTNWGPNIPVIVHVI